MTNYPSTQPTPSPASSRSADERATQTAKKIALALLAIVAAWLLAAVFAPDPTIDGEGARRLLTMPLLACCGAAIALFSLDGFGFAESQLSNVRAGSLMAGVIAGSLWFVLGVLTADPFTMRTVLHLLFAALLVAALVGAISALAQLAVRKLG